VGGVRDSVVPSRRRIQSRVFGLGSEPLIRVAREQVQQDVVVVVVVVDDGNGKSPDYSVCSSGSSAMTSAMTRWNSPLSRHSRKTA